MGALQMLNECGDVTIVWDEAKDAEMEEIIRKKMKEGVTFFIVEPRMQGLAAPEKTKLKRAADAKKYRALAIPDEDLLKFVESGSGDAVSSPAGRVKTKKISRDPKEVAKSESVGVRPRQGG